MLLINKSILSYLILPYLMVFSVATLKMSSITCNNCKDQYVGSAINFKERFRVHKSDIKTGKIKCGVAKHFINVCSTPGKLDNLRVQVIEQVQCENVN